MDQHTKVSDADRQNLTDFRAVKSLNLPQNEGLALICGKAVHTGVNEGSQFL